MNSPQVQDDIRPGTSPYTEGQDCYFPGCRGPLEISWHKYHEIQLRQWKVLPPGQCNAMQVYSMAPAGWEAVWQKGTWPQCALAAKTHNCTPGCRSVKEQPADEGKLFLPTTLCLWVHCLGTVSHLGHSSTRRTITYQIKFSGGPPQWSGSGALVLWWEAEGAGLVQLE